MCLPKGILKTVIAVVGIACILGGASCMYFGQKFLGNSAVSHFTKDFKFLPYAFVYGAGAFLILIGIFQLAACKSENRCLICLVLFCL